MYHIYMHIIGTRLLTTYELKRKKKDSRSRRKTGSDPVILPLLLPPSSQIANRELTGSESIETLKTETGVVEGPRKFARTSAEEGEQ